MGGGKHGSLGLILDKDDYGTVTREFSATIDWLPKSAPVRKSITLFSAPFETLTLQEAQKVKKSAYKLQEAATDIGVGRIFECIEEQYL